MIHSWSEVWHFKVVEGLHTHKSQGLLHWTGAKTKKRLRREAWASYQRRCGAERLACFAAKKIGWGHRPQCLIRQCFYPASTLKLGRLLLLGWEQLNCTRETKRTLTLDARAKTENTTHRGNPPPPLRASKIRGMERKKDFEKGVYRRCCLRRVINIRWEITCTYQMALPPNAE